MNNLAFIFPGQGSQSVGMLSELAANYPIVQQTFAEASSVLGYDLWALSQQGSTEELNQTEVTQVLMLTADIAVFRAIQQQVSLPDNLWMAGHSLGEYAALVAADSLSLVDAVQLVSQRATLMQNTVPQGIGGMAAIVGLTDQQTALICQRASSEEELVSPANFNAIGQVVIAGHMKALKAALALAEAQGARLAKIIPVSVPCHCSLLNDAASQFVSALNDVSFKSPIYQVISNVDVSCYQSAEQIRSLLAKQLYSPVRWVEIIQQLSMQGIEIMVECGPGKVLTGLVKRIDKTITSYNAGDAISLHQVVSLVSQLN